MPIWLNNGQLVFTGGMLIYCADCPCGCPYCDGTTPESVLLSFTGVVDGGGCFDCDYWNTNSFELLRVSNCEWAATVDGPVDCRGPYDLHLTISENLVELTVLGSDGLIIFELAVTTPIDCDNITDIPNISTPSLMACGWTDALATIAPV